MSTLYKYISKKFLIGISVCYLSMSAIIFLADLVEHTRRVGSKEVDFSVLLTMTSLHFLPLNYEVLPFIVLFGSFGAFHYLNRHSELVVVRSAGYSIWQTLFFPLVISGLLGVFFIGFLNPLSSSFSKKYEEMEYRYLKGSTKMLSISIEGMWFRQADALGQSVIHAQEVTTEGKHLKKVIIFKYDSENQFSERLDAEEAKLMNNYWQLDHVLKTNLENKREYYDNLKYPTKLTHEDIKESFSSPKTMSFWDLPKFIRILEDSGFKALEHKLYFHELLTLPLILCSMVIVAAVCTGNLKHTSRTSFAITGCVIVGFLVFFFLDLSEALGASGTIPPLFAAWAPPTIVTLLGAVVLLHYADG